LKKISAYFKEKKASNLETLQKLHLILLKDTAYIQFAFFKANLYGLWVN